MAATAQEIKESRGVPLVFKIGAVLAYIVLLLPVLIVVLAGLNSGDYLTFPPQGISLRWVIHFLTSGTFLKAFLFSFILAIMTMAISTTLGTMVAVFLSRVNFPGKNLTRAFFLSPIILPGIILGLALYVFYATTFTSLLRTIPGLLLGHVLVTVPFVIGAVSAALANYDVSLEDAARSLGAGPLKAFRKVTLPNISNGVMAGSIFAFIVSFGQFDISLFLSTPNFTPLPIAMYVSLRYQFEPTAAAAGIFAITLVTVSMILTSKLISFKKFSGVKF